MDIELKYKIVEKIIQIDDDALLNEIKTWVGLSDDDFWEDLPYNIKQDIDAAIEQLDRGRHSAYTGDGKNKSPLSE